VVSAAFLCQLNFQFVPGKLLKHRKPLAEAIRFHRRKANLTQEKLAELADLNPKYIGEIERGMKNISVDALMRIATATKTHVRDFFDHL
jgi:transcriptional regulator with XRE-family HTH domain